MWKGRDHIRAIALGRCSRGSAQDRTKAAHQHALASIGSKPSLSIVNHKRNPHDPRAMDCAARFDDVVPRETGRALREPCRLATQCKGTCCGTIESCSTSIAIIPSTTARSRSRQRELRASEEWARCLAASRRSGLHSEAHRRIHNGPRAGTFCLSEFTLLLPRIQTVIRTTAASLCRSTTDRAGQSTSGKLGMVDNRNRLCTRLQADAFVFSNVLSADRNDSSRISPSPAIME